MTVSRNAFLLSIEMKFDRCSRCLCRPIQKHPTNYTALALSQYICQPLLERLSPIGWGGEGGGGLEDPYSVFFILIFFMLQSGNSAVLCDSLQREH